MVTLDQFKEIQLRVARILEATEHPSADRLFILSIDLGEEKPRQIVAGIRGRYTAAELIGKSIIVVANLQPAVIRGVESNGMLLAAKDADGLTLLMPERAAAPGSTVG